MSIYDRFPSFDDLRPEAGLPDLLRMLDGQMVSTADAWWSQRRPELRALFEWYMYGIAPPPPERVTSRVLFEDRAWLAGAATLKELELRYHPTAPVMRLLISIPNKRSGRVPVFVGANFGGNHTETDHPAVAMPEVWIPEKRAGVVDNRATEAGRGASPRYDFAQGAARGYAVATFHNGDIDPDRPDFTDGIHPHYQPSGAVRGAHDWGTIAAWAWGLMRAVDYLVTDPAIDARRIAATGHSRNGKVALLAAAFDQRIALTAPLQAGMGGTAPNRGTVGESVRAINDRFPHWFCDEYKRFNDEPARLPFDQHALVAMCAPRPVLFCNATEDQWANPAGQFGVLKAAGPVYRLLGVDGLNGERMPEVNELSAGRLGYWIRPGKHSMKPEDWTIFFDFADRWMQ